MKRPLFLFSFIWFVLTIALLNLPQVAVIPIGVLISVLGLLTFIPFFQRAAYVLVVSALVMAFVYKVGYDQIVTRPEMQLSGTTARITGTVEDIIYEKEDSYYAVLDVSSIDGNKDSLSKPLRVFMTKTTAIGDEVFLAVKFANANIKNQYLSAAVLDSVQITGKSNSLKYSFKKLQYSLSENLQSRLEGQEGAVASGMCVGDKSDISQTTYSGYRNSGIAHLLAVSGMHISIVIGVFIAIVGPSKRLLRLFVCGGATIVYMAIIGFTPSVTRAGIMFILIFAGSAIFRRADAVTSLGVVMLLACLTNPYLAGSASLLMSLSATFGAIKASEILAQHKSKFAAKGILGNICFYAVSSLTISAFASIFVIPAIILADGGISIIGPLIGLITIPVLPIIIFAGIVGSVSAFFPILSMITQPMILVCGLAVKYVNTVAGIFENRPEFYFKINNEYAIVVMAIIALLIWYAVFLKNKKMIFAIGAVFCFSIIYNMALSFNGITVSQIGNGGNSSIILTTGQKSILFWRGNDRNIRYTKEYLEESHIEDILFLNLTTRPENEVPFEDLATEYYIGVKEIQSRYKEVDFGDDIDLIIQKQGKGTSCIIDIKGIKILIPVGEVDIINYPKIDICFPSTKEIKAITADVLVNDSSPQWAKDNSNMIDFASENPEIWIRPEKAIKYRGV